MKKSGLADSPLFAAPQSLVQPPAPVFQAQADEPVVPQPEKSTQPKQKKTSSIPPAPPDTMPPRHPAATHAITVAGNLGGRVAEIRRAVKAVGKEAATHRFTVEEKQQLARLIFGYRESGLKTSENEITRIAINFILQDHEANGSNSLLDKVLKALNE
ncbi:MAG: hypothetical protein KC441_10285 [Anaerolineales bacterium]|nr:hypothetical protein [Anaerolineales bacterium]